MRCDACPRHCLIDRPESQNDHSALGFCKMPENPVLAKACLHFGEEPCLSGSRGAGTVFFSGCNLRCIFCQNYAISREGFGKEVTVQRLREIFEELIQKGVHVLDLVTPSHYGKAIHEALKEPLPVPVVYNSGGYDSLSTLKLLNGQIDVYLPDLKYVSSDLGKRYSGAPEYPDVAKAAILEMFRQVGPVQIGDDGIMKKGVLIRHLLLPGHLSETKKVLDWIADTFEPGSVWVSLMAQYTPTKTFSEDFRNLNRKVTTSEITRAQEYLIQKGLTFGYMQDRSSSGDSYIPLWDLEGI